MTDTQKRIREYKEKLPGLKERVMAVAALLILSATMLTTVSFAWITLSRSPEVSGVATTVAANGNLEIALVGLNGALPGESKVGDSTLPIVERNLTWGNLVNLSDPAYGLDNLVLRPAQLNPSSLLNSPLYGAVYSEDGRVEKLNSSFAYTIWNPAEGNVPGYFGMAGGKYGVRAISSTKIEAVGFAEEVYEKRNAAEGANLLAGSSYLSITQNSSYMNTLATVMGTFMTAKMNAGQGDESLTNPTIAAKDVENLRDIFAAFITAYDLQYEAWAELLNYQLFLKNNSETGSTPYTSYTAEDLKPDSEGVPKVTEASLETLGLKATGLNTFNADYPKLKEGYEKLVQLAESGAVKWADSELDDIVNGLMNVGTCTLDGTPINDIGVSNAMGYLDGNTHNAVITNGVLYNFEKANGTHCKVEDLSVSAKVKRIGMTIPATISANITTNAPVPSSFATDLEYSDTLNQGAKGTEVAEDTYGLAIDFWVRTNADASHLILGGNVITKEEEVEVMGKDANGNDVKVYTVQRTEEAEKEDGTTETVTYTIDLYQVLDESGNIVEWRNLSSHEVFTLNENETPAVKMETITTVIGYEGDNRVWDGSMMSTDATTQGAGSCYVYYADTPEDQARSLKLLEAFNVVFVDDQGTKLATARMDTEHFYAESGRVIVPLVLDTSDSVNLGTDASGNTTYAITALEKNVAKRITALVFLDGTKLDNDDVLAAADIQGQLNIQFASTANLNPTENEELYNKELAVSATVDKTEFDYDTATGPMTTNVTVNITGDQPTTVTAFFLRKINSTQGSREEKITFTQNGNTGQWTSNYTFKYPGVYILRTVSLDGVEHELSVEEGQGYPTVTVNGFTIESLSVSQAENKHINIMTAANSSSVDVNLRFASSDEDKMPTTVSGRFLREDGVAANIPFTYDSNTGFWKGKTTFLASGEYTLQYLVINGEYTEIPETMWHTATIRLGMKVAVYTTSPTKFLYKPSEWRDSDGNLTEEGSQKANLHMQVMVMDNSGAELLGLTNVVLNYGKKGTSIVERGMSANLTWNAETGYYEGNFASKIGMYDFVNVTVGSSNTITYATTSPSFVIQSPEPPTFNTGNSVAYQYAPNNDAVLKVIFNNCEAATMSATLIRTKDKVETVYENIEGEPKNGEWVFEIPKDSSGYQDGEWRITEIKIWDVYSADGTEYTEENPLVFDMTGKDGVSSKVVSQIDVVFTDNKSKNFEGKNFMEEYTISGLYVNILDFAEEAIVSNGTLLVQDVKLIFTYTSGTSSTYGGYRSDALNNETEGATITIPLVVDGNDKTLFKQKDNASILFAGEYETTLEFTINNVKYNYAGETLPANAPIFTVSTNSPTVKVKGVSPGTTASHRIYGGTLAADGSVSVDPMLTGAFNRYSDYMAVVYIYGGDSNEYNVYIPQVTLQLTEMPDSEFSASMTFNNNANSSYNATYTFISNNQSVENEIGDGSNGVPAWRNWGNEIKPKIYPAGKQTVDEITVVYGGITYTVDLSHKVTINQPQYPPYADFVDIKSIEGTYTGSTPSRVYGEPQTDGTFQIKLPTSSAVTTSWTELIQESVTSNETTNTTTTTYYETWTSWWQNHYQQYDKYVTVTQAEETLTEYTRTYTITGWSVGGKTYGFGDTITVTGPQTVTAIISYTDGPRETNIYDLVRTTTYYVAGKDTRGDTPDGPNITEDPDQGNRDNWTESNPNIVNERVLRS